MKCHIWFFLGICIAGLIGFKLISTDPLQGVWQQEYTNAPRTEETAPTHLTQLLSFRADHVLSFQAEGSFMAGYSEDNLSCWNGRYTRPTPGVVAISCGSVIQDPTSWKQYQYTVEGFPFRNQLTFHAGPWTYRYRRISGWPRGL